MFLRKYWIPLSVFLVAIVGIGLYLLATQPPPEPVKIYKAVEPIEKPTPQAPVGDTSKGGHFHADGTWHEGPHEPVEPPSTAQGQSPVEPGSSEISTTGAGGLPLSIGEQVAASDDVPKYAVLKAMRDEELRAMHLEYIEKQEQLSAELWKRMRAFGEAEVGSDEAKSRLEALDAVAWEYNVYQITSSRAADVLSRRLIKRNFNRPHGPGEMIIYPLPELTD
ncbi:hypothetical protein F4054_12415 [Candidatus Poribacteria bacterium]|nr:hypothetical protein [Candidatus Poribacteria bacterium]MYK23047.1 hypothetical protein [Candidatus Poribacteria bacterium]